MKLTPPFFLGSFFISFKPVNQLENPRHHLSVLLLPPLALPGGALFLVPVALCLLIHHHQIFDDPNCLLLPSNPHEISPRSEPLLWSISSKEKILAWNTQWPILVVKSGGATLFFQTFATSHNFNRMGLLFSLKQQLMQYQCNGVCMKEIFLMFLIFLGKFGLLHLLLLDFSSFHNYSQTERRRRRCQMTFLGIVVSVSSALASSMIENCIESSLKTLMVRVGVIFKMNQKLDKNLQIFHGIRIKLPDKSYRQIIKHQYIALFPKFLSQNIVNEKIYIFLWFWFIILGGLSALVIVYRFVIVVSPKMRAYLLYIRFRLIKREVINTIVKKSKMGDWFLFYMLGQNVDSIIFKEVMHELARRLGHQSKDFET